MRNLFFTAFFVVFLQNLLAQTNMNTKYDAKWKAVKNAFQKGLNKTAQTEIESIIKVAKAEHNIGQIIKGFCNYRVSLRDRDEKARLHDIVFFEKELKDASFPVKQVLHSMIGDLYWSYYEENRWKILDRTKVENIDAPNFERAGANTILDIETWSADDFYNKAFEQFTASLTEKEKSKAFPLKNLTTIVEKGANTETLRPTLFDFLANRAIEYFSKEETDITKPTYAFEINDEKAFASVSTFVNASFNTSDKTSQKFNVLKLYQEILLFHSNDSDPSALIDADIARIQYVNDKSIAREKKEWYKNALKAIADTYPANEQAAMATYLYAETFTQGGQHVGRMAYLNSGFDDSKVDYVEAKKWCDYIVEKFPKTEASSRAESLLQQIEQKSLGIRVEKVVLANQPSLAMVSYKEVKTMYCKIVKVTNQEIKDKTYDYNNDYQVLASRKGIKDWQVALPDKHDYKAHSTEIKIEALPFGTYAIIVSEDKDFNSKKYYAIAFLRVSNLAHVQVTEQDKDGTGIYVVDRASGQALENVSVHTWINSYNYESRKYQPKAGPVFKTNKEGYVNIQRVNPNQGGYALELIKGDDVLYLDDNIYINEYYPQPDNDYVRTFLFTDRSIYRPGQTIYFKGISVMQKTKGGHKTFELIKDRKTSVTLKDVNYQDIKTIELTSNEYGSFTGTFIAPQGLLSGQFQIVAESGQALFNIEEYKRPKFEVRYDTLKGTYKINESIKVRGLAKAFAGNAIDGAKVSYRVVRNARFPYYWCFYRWGAPSSASMEITHGSTTTQTDGSFDISFNAIPDESIDKQTKPIFDYTIYADVTDLNGETRSGETIVSVGYESLLLKIETPEQVDFNNFNAVKIFSTNLAGIHVPAQVTLTLKKLVSPSKTYRKRLWEHVEIQSISEEAFRKDFPLDEYKNENDYLQWKEEKVIWSKTFTTTQEGLEYLQKTGASQGWFVLEARAKDLSADKAGKDANEVIDKKYIRLSSNTNPQSLPNEHLLVTKVKTAAEPGEDFSFTISNPYEKIFLLYCVQPSSAKHEIANPSTIEWQSISGNKTYTYTIKESDRGGFYVSGWFIKDNRYYSFQESILVPWSNKQLTLSLQTFRNKMLPGSEQEWTLKITGSQKEKVSAELLATMYDASLDAFKPHYWQDFYLFAGTNQKIQFNTSSNFIVEPGRQFYFGTYKNVHSYDKRYPSLLWWGLNNSYSYFGMSEGGRPGGKGMLRGQVVMEDAVADAPMVARAPAKLAAKEEAGALQQDDQKALNNVATPIAADSMQSRNASSSSAVSLRSNFNETAFFFPQLQTDAEGNILLKFKAPDALTRWKLMAFGHTKELQSGSLTETATTSKELMIVPNTPRFFREGDKMVYSAKVTNLSDHDLSGKADLILIDALTNQPISTDFGLTKQSMTEPLSLKKGESASVNWQISIPQSYTNPVLVKTIAQAGDFSDGEQNVVPVLLNSMLVTETLPLPVRMNTTKNFQFENLLKSKNSNTLKHYNLTVEYTANPAWYAVQALPYLSDYPYECAEQTFNRYYANVLATHIANSSPKVREIFSTWESKDTAALLSNLEKNQELKSALLQETPWVLQAKSESQQKQHIANLFNLNRMSTELERTVRELEIMQTPNGGFTWFKGMPDDRFITQYILCGIGRLLHIGITEVGSERRILQIVEKALPYLDARIKEDYDQLKKNGADMALAHIDHQHIQYLYMRSFFRETSVAPASITAFNYYKKQAATYWLRGNKYMQGMTALALNRWDDTVTRKTY
ncbi:MAG: hypothetical protein IPJ31_15590 [Bacteroidetes bacterium]|nr:hypothetical protein [Bacteroidota bacterium]